jgi:hypothetical protein
MFTMEKITVTKLLSMARVQADTLRHELGRFEAKMHAYRLWNALRCEDSKYGMSTAEADYWADVYAILAGDIPTNLSMRE